MQAQTDMESREAARRGKKLMLPLVWALVVFLLCEVTLNLFTPAALHDFPYYFGFAGTPHYFQPHRDAGSQAMYIPADHSQLPADTFAVSKPDTTFRIFVLGGSTVYGEPWGPSGSFAHWLEHRLNYFSNSIHFEVINAGHKGFGSYRVKVILREILDYEPDLIILYSGVNELRDFEFHKREIAIENRPLLRSLKRIADHSHLFRLFFTVFVKSKITSHAAGSIKAVLERPPGDLSAYEAWFERTQLLNDLVVHSPHSGAADSSWQRLESRWVPHVRTCFRSNLIEMATLAQQRGVPLLLLSRARNFYNSIAFLDYFRHHDPSRQEMQAVAAAFGLPLISALDVVTQTFGRRIGFDAFADDVHPSLACNIALADALFDTIVTRGLPALACRVTPVREKHFQALRTALVEQQQPNANVLALRGWRYLIEHLDHIDDTTITMRIVDLAEAAIARDPQPVHPYLLLGMLARARGDTAMAVQTWHALNELYPQLRGKAKPDGPVTR